MSTGPITESDIAEIVAQVPWIYRRCPRVDVRRVARECLGELSRAGTYSASRYSTQPWKRKQLVAMLKARCAPRGFALMSGLLSLIIGAAIAAVVEACVCWWMEHRVLPKD